MDLVTFLTTRLDAEQRLAEAAAKEASPRFDIDGTHWRSTDGEYVSCEEMILAVGPYGSIGDAIVDHMVAHDPAHVLADIAAHRAVIDLYRANRGLMAARGHNAEDESRLWLLEAVLTRLAAPHRQHPDFDPAWRVD